MIELNVIDIDGKQYFEIEYIKGKTNTYYYYGNEENPEDFKIFKGVIKDDQEFLEELNYDEFNEAAKLFNEKHHNSNNRYNHSLDVSYYTYKIII